MKEKRITDYGGDKRSPQSMSEAPGKREGKRPTFLGVAVLARHDPQRPYSIDNCYWRTAVSEEEARQGTELYVGADLRDRFLELERRGWIELDEERRRLVMQLGAKEIS